YNPDITLFLRQAKEQGLKFKAIIGHGAGHSQIDRLRATFGEDVNYFHSIDPAAAQLLDPKSLKPGIAALIQEMTKRYQAVNGPGRIAWPREVQTRDPVLPFPKGHAFAP